jgi:uncharacterized protein YlxW (UPF0749 family)
MNPELMSLLITAIGTGITIVSVIITVNKGTAENAQQTGMILQEMKDMREDLRDIKADARDTASRLSQIDNRLSKVEQYVANDDKRISNLESIHMEGNVR